MLKVEFIGGDNNVYSIVLLNEWDFEDGRYEKATYSADKSNIGKWFPYDDGSGWYSKVIRVNPDYDSVRTEAGVIRLEDYIRQCKIMGYHVNYSGVFRGNEHPLIRPYNSVERIIAGQIAKGNGDKYKYKTPRMYMIALEKLQAELDHKGVNEDFVTTRLLREVDNMRGTIKDRLEVLKTMCRMMGIEMEKQEQKQLPAQPLFGNIGTLTIQQARRQISDKPDIRKMVNMAEKNVSDAVIEPIDETTETNK